MIILQRCRAAKRDIDRLEQRIEQRRDVLSSISGPQVDPNGVIRGSGDADKVGRIMADIDELEREIAARREEAEIEKVSACALMDMVPELEGKILYAYYVKRMDTGEIGRKEKFTAGYVRKVKRGGEQLLEMLSPETVAGTLPPWYLRKKSEGGKHDEEKRAR